MANYSLFYKNYKQISIIKKIILNKLLLNSSIHHQKLAPASIQLGLHSKFSTVNVAAPIMKSKMKKDDQDKPHLNVGTIGHVDHGKTTLTSAITKVLSKYGQAKFLTYEEIDRSAEEKRRGITINVMHVGYSSKTRRYSHSDCPGHADYIKNMICGTSQMDGAILVVAATDGQMPQTREHLLLARQIGIKKVIVFITKADLVDKEVIDLVEIEVRELLTDFGFEGEETPFVYGSPLLALNGDSSEMAEGSILKLMEVLDNYFTLPERDFKSPFLMPIESSVTFAGRGTVVVGTLQRGTLKKGNPAVLLGYDNIFKTVATEIQMFKQSVEKCQDGDHVGILVRSVKSKDLERGYVLCPPNTYEIHNRFAAKVYLLTGGEGGRKWPLTNGILLQIFSHTWNVPSRADMPPQFGDMLMPGDHGVLHLTLLWKMVLNVGQPFTIREKKKVIGTGIITDILADIEINDKPLGKLEIPH